MTHWRQIRPLTRAGDIDQARALLVALVAEWGRPDAGATQRAMATAVDNRFSANASGAGGSGGGGGGSPVEQALMGRDPIADFTAELLMRQRRMQSDAAFVLAGLQGWRQDRPTQLCPRCNMPMAQGFKRCQQIIDGVQCGARAGAVEVPTCDDCRTEQPRSNLRPFIEPGTGRRLTLCVSDWMWRHRHDGRARVSVARLARDAADLVAADGTYSTGE